MEEKTAFDTFAEVFKVNLHKELQHYQNVDSTKAYLCLSFGLNFLSGFSNLKNEEEKQKLQKIWRHIFSAFVRLEPGIEKLSTLLLLYELIDYPQP